MTASFTVNLQAMLGLKHKGVLSLNLKKLANRVADVKIVLILIFFL